MPRSVPESLLAARLLAELRAARPLVHNITNYVAMDVAANALLALGASPAMAHAREEAAEFTGISGALCINIGTLSTPWVEAMEMAAAAALRLGRPWVLDPVGVGATVFRDETVQRLLALRPTILRGNASEIMATASLAGMSTVAATPKGVDSANSVDQAAEIAIALAGKLGCVVVATGSVDLVTDGARQVRLGNGHQLMTRVTALGCALSATIAAFAAVSTPFEAAVAGTAIYGIAGEMAGETARGPGSFRTAFLDALDAIGDEDIHARLKVLP